MSFSGFNTCNNKHCPLHYLMFLSMVRVSVPVGFPLLPGDSVNCDSAGPILHMFNEQIWRVLHFLCGDTGLLPLLWSFCGFRYMDKSHRRGGGE